ncbi:hypothetical protein [Guptibacillus hwajinpoensis]|uniref:hypothetical protein n=1 Tax=Guptibacillus hwajinpoensis TaxID=208199 RepID=UPI00384E86C4
MSKMKLSMNEVISLYESGSSTSEISLLAGVSDRHIRQLLTNNGVEKRARGSWKRKYSFKEDYFKHWTNDMAYLLEFFIADGYIASTFSIQINLYIRINIPRYTACFFTAKL